MLPSCHRLGIPRGFSSNVSVEQTTVSFPNLIGYLFFWVMLMLAVPTQPSRSTLMRYAPGWVTVCVLLTVLSCQAYIVSCVLLLTIIVSPSHKVVSFPKSSLGTGPNCTIIVSPIVHP